MKVKGKILIVDDELRVINALKRVFDKNKYEIFSTTIPEDALNILNNNTVDIIICDHNMPNMSGIDVLKSAKDISPDAIRILITGYSDVNIAVSAINEGSIYYFFSKPWKNEEIIAVVEKAVIYKREQERKVSLYEVLNDSKEHLVEVAKQLKFVGNIVEGPVQEKKEVTQEKIIRKFPVKEDENIVLINPIEILYLMAINGDVFVITEMGKYKSSDSLNWWEKNLVRNNFFRCHRSYIINIDRIEKIIPWFNGAYNIKLKNVKENIPVSRGAMKKLKELLGL